MEDNKPATVERAIGARIKMLRSQKDMTQTDLAKLLGVKFQQVQKYENGTNRVSASRLNMIMDIFQVSWIFFFNQPSSKPQAYGDGFADDATPFEMPHPEARLVDEQLENSVDAVFDIMGTNDGVKLSSAFSRIKDVDKRKLVINLAESLSSSE